MDTFLILSDAINPNQGNSPMKTLHLTLKAHYFNEILQGKKTEEYREIKWYWIRRFFTYHGWNRDECMSDELIDDLRSLPKNHHSFSDLLDDFDFKIAKYDTITFKNGYSKNAPTMVVEFLGLDVGVNIETPLGKRNFFTIKLGKIISTLNLNTETRISDAKK